MRRSVIAAAASAALLACLGACSGGSEPDASSVLAPVTPIVASTPTPADPYAWTGVPYGDYLDAAEQLGIRPDLLRPLSGFSSGLNALCHTPPDQMVELRKAQLANTEDAAAYSVAQYMHDEVALRIGMACPQRMPDWSTAAGTGAVGTGGGEDDPAVTDEDLARATAEEEAGATAPAFDPTGYGPDGSTDDTTAGSTGDSSADTAEGTPTGADGVPE